MSRFFSAVERFKKTGDFLELTRQFELGIPVQKCCQLGPNNIKLLDTGVLLIEPKTPSNLAKDIIISSGIHGNETAPIEIVNRLVIDIITHKRAVKHRTLFIIGNPVAMNMSKRFQTENLNRLFCKKHLQAEDSYERNRAEQLEAYVTDFFSSENSKDSIKYHYDLHTAIRASKYEKFAIYPYQENKAWDKQQLSFLQHSGINTVLFGHAPSGTFSYFSSSEFNAHAFTVELGKVKPFGENDMANFHAIQSNLSALILGNNIELDEFNNNNFNLFKVLGDITKETDNFKLYIEDDVSNFTDYPIGTLLSEDESSQYKTSQSGESIVFPNAQVANGQRAGLLVVPTTL